MKYRKRQNVSELGYSAKSIIDPLSCHAMHNHYCWGVNKLYDDGDHMAFIEPEVALLHHYKKCRLENLNGKASGCRAATVNGVQDDTMFKYREALSKAVDEKLALIGDL